MELSGSDASSAMSFGSDAEMPEDPIEEPVYLGRKRERFYKIILERGEGIDKPGTIDEIVVRHCGFSEDLTQKPFVTLNLGRGALPDYVEKGIVSMKKNEIADLHVPETLTGTEAEIVKIELQSFINIHDLHANRMLIKKVLQKSGEISRISDKDEVVFSISIRQNSEFILEETEMDTIVGISILSEGIFEILRTMKLREKSEIQVKNEYFREKFEYICQGETDPIVSIEILKLDKLTDIYVNGGFYKKTLETGLSDTLYPNSQIEFEYKLEYSGNTIEGTLIAFIDECVLPSLWEDTLKLMKIGESAKIQCFPNDRIDNLRDGFTEKFNCPENNPQIYFKILRLISGGPVYEMEENEKLDLAKRMKIVGSELFKRNLFTKAIDKYDNGLGALNPIKDNMDMYKDTFISLQLNIAMCFFKLKDYSKCISRCEKVIDVESGEFRAFYRKGMALKMSFEYLSAMEQFEKGKVIAIEKNQELSVKEFEKELTQVAAHIEAYHKKEKKIYANLFK